MPAKVHRKSNKPASQDKKSGPGDRAGEQRYSVPKTSTHNDAECYIRTRGSVPLTPVVRTRLLGCGSPSPRPDDTEKKTVVNFGDDFYKGFAFQHAKLQRGPPAKIEVALSRRGRQKDDARITANKVLGIAGKTTFGIATALLDGTTGVSGVAALTTVFVGSPKFIRDGATV